MLFTLPSLEEKTKHISKNYIYHKIEPEQNRELTFGEPNSNYILLSGNEKQCCLTHDENNAEAASSHIILTKRKNTTENIENNKIEFKRWLKHPKKKNYSCEDILNTWDDSFKFIEENSTTATHGLRNPQIGAIHSVLGHFRIADEIGIVVLPTGTGKQKQCYPFLSLINAKES